MVFQEYIRLERCRNSNHDESTTPKHQTPMVRRHEGRRTGGGAELHHDGLLQFGQQRIQLEVFSTHLSPGGNGDLFRTGNEVDCATKWRTDDDLK